MFEEISVAWPSVSAWPWRSEWLLRMRNPLTSRPSPRLGLLGERGLRRDRAGAQAGDRRDDLEHGTRHVAAKRRARQQGIVGIVLERLERLHGGARVGDRRGVVRRCRGEREDLAGRGVEHDDRALPVAQRADGRPLQVVGQRQVEILRVVRVTAELPQCIGQRIHGEAGKLGAVGTFQPGRPEPPGRVADDLADRPVGVGPIQLTVLVPLVPGEHGPAPVEDPAALHGARRGDDRRVVGRPDEIGRDDDAPVAGRGCQRTERKRDGDRDMQDADTNRAARADRSEHQSAPRCSIRRQRRSRGAGGGSTPRSDSARSRPMTRPFASSDEPP